MINNELKSPALDIRHASIKDFEAITKMIGRANAYSAKQSNGTLQWTKIDFVHSQLRAHIDSGELFVAGDNKSSVIGCVALTEKDSMWSDDGETEALYFHKLMKDPEARKDKTNIAAHLLGFIAEEAARRHKSVVRCDVKDELPRLVEYYKKLGFTIVGSAEYGSTGLTAHLMEINADNLAKTTVL